MLKMYALVCGVRVVRGILRHVAAKTQRNASGVNEPYELLMRVQGFGSRSPGRPD